MNFIILDEQDIVQNIIVADLGFVTANFEHWAYASDYPDAQIGEPLPVLRPFRIAKLSEIGQACEEAITAGVDVDGGHYSLTEHDQIELMAQQAAIQGGAAAVPYHADGQLCRLYPAEEFLLVAGAAAAHIFTHRTYCNHLNAWIRRAESAEELATITYGAELPEDLAAHMAEILGSGELENTAT